MREKNLNKYFNLIDFIVPIQVLFKGYLIINLLFSPLTILMTAYLTIMGGSDSKNSGLFNTLVTVLGFVYGLPLVLLAWLIGFGKLIDFLLQIIPLKDLKVSWMGILGASILFVIAGNFFIDHLYQFKKGNYSISIYALFIIMLYPILLFLFSKLPLSNYF